MRAWAFMAFVWIGGCGGDFDPASLITYSRVIGARVGVQGDTERAWPMPGETIDVSWLIAHPSMPNPLTWAFVACPSGAAQYGVPFCDSTQAPLAFVCNNAPELNPRSLRVSVPTDASQDVLVLGLFCANGLLPFECDEVLPQDLSGENLECQGEAAHKTAVSLDIPLQIEGETNHNPAIKDVLIADVPWPSVAVTPEQTCPIDGVPALQIRPTVVSLSVIADSSSRESYVQNNEEKIETLQISYFATAGELSRQFEFIGEETSTSPLTWEAPPVHAVPASGMLVHFYFVMRDGRGGTASTERFLCLVP